MITILHFTTQNRNKGKPLLFYPGRVISLIPHIDKPVSKETYTLAMQLSIYLDSKHS